MMMTNYEISPLKGIGNIQFSMSKTEIETILGKPNDIDEFYAEKDDALQTEVWYYDELGISLGFESSKNWTLETIEIDSPLCKLYETTIFNLNFDSIQDLLESNHCKDLQVEVLEENVEGNLKTLESEKLNMVFYFENNQLSEVQLTS